jgi:hypothetical protein
MASKPKRSKPEFDSLDHGVAAKGGPKPEFDSLDSWTGKNLVYIIE